MENSFRTCLTCNIEKSISLFYKRNDTKKYCSSCKECVCKRRKNYRENNAEKIKIRNKKRYKKNRESELKKHKIYYQKNKERIKQKSREWKKKNPNYYKEYYTENLQYHLKRAKEYVNKNKNKVIKRRREFHIKNKESQNLKSAKWKQKNKQKIRDYKNHKYKTDITYNLNSKMSVSIKNALKKNKNNIHWELLVGYTKEDLIKRLKKTIPKGYNWDDFLKGKLHIDHIIPKSLFHYKSPFSIDFKKCWGLNNLQLLPAQENMNKGNKYDKPFQTILSLEL